MLPCQFLCPDPRLGSLSAQVPGNCLKSYFKYFFFKPSTALQSFPESSTAAGGRGTWECFFIRTIQVTWTWSEADTISLIRTTRNKNHHQCLAMRLKKWQLQDGYLCNYCRATSSQWALSDSHPPLLCTSHPGENKLKWMKRIALDAMISYHRTGR